MAKFTSGEKEWLLLIGCMKQFYWKIFLWKSWCLLLWTFGYLDKCPFFALKAAKTANIFNYPLTASNGYANMISENLKFLVVLLMFSGSVFGLVTHMLWLHYFSLVRIPWEVSGPHKFNAVWFCSSPFHVFFSQLAVWCDLWIAARAVADTVWVSPRLILDLKDSA